ncbi:MAG: DUF6259 domain-containing protein, partial [Oliverpabstia sp.]
MILKSKNSEIIISEENGSVVSYKINGKEFCMPGYEKRPLFTIKMIDDNGTATYYNSLQSERIEFTTQSNGCKIVFHRISEQELCAEVSIIMDEKGMCHWQLNTENGTGLRQEWFEFPQITVPNRLKDDGGEFELFWPAMEGLIIGTCRHREILTGATQYREIGYQSQGLGGFYPGVCQMQFMAFYDSDAGLYFAAHDPMHHPKTVEFREENNGIALEFRLFNDAAKGKYRMSYAMVTAGFEGDWHDAAEIYRNWMQENTDMPMKLKDSVNTPKWLSDAPLVMIYPVRGNTDTGDMTPNLYYPYKNILPITEKFSDKTNSKIMTLLMHWEGTAPWAPPYVWPPFGGEEQFKDFVDTMHNQGNLVGVYCSGIGWTVKSTLQPDFDMSDRYDESLICRTPADTIEQTKIIGDDIRYGLDMCPYDTEKVGNIASGEILSIAKSGCDYAQYFDQNLGGESSFCYAQNHGHPAGPGIWQNEAMIKLFRKIRMDLNAIGSNMLLGCESASSEPYIEYLKFNDLRYVFGFLAGKPVPAYAYLFHEYINNFMGNQDWIEGSMDPEKNPDCLLFRLAYSFIAGDILSVTLGDQGNIIWGWGVRWDKKIPEQEKIFTLIRNLNAWRREYKEFLHLGKMVKPLQLEETHDYTLYLREEIKLVYQTLLTSRWENAEGIQKQVIVNFMPYEQT